MADTTTPAAAQQVRIAIVTGAASGIGRSIALRLAADGLDILINDLPASESALNGVADEIRALGRRAVTFCGDISEEAVVRDLVDKAVNEFGGVDVMVANAGMATMGTLVEMEVEQWDRTMTVNLRGTMLAYKYAGRQMIKQNRGGRLFAASSILGKKGYPNFSAYCATKFGIRGITQAAAVEFGPHNITVNAYAPGLINTPMIRTPFDDGEDGAMLRKLTGLHDVRKEEPEVIASLVSYLAKPEAHFITGQTINVDGGVAFD
ncbi:NAD-P-binding protein [Athelia psychrophila]|uniref:NAD-P-binding protein n=1 Tax=Athelia psychrophila TaxID=1759441 RepID=A0A166DG61_9AGAM|nr:NAD-P-binding protein [Fibularhizoctonia sp. CBS 109695]